MILPRLSLVVSCALVVLTSCKTAAVAEAPAQPAVAEISPAPGSRRELVRRILPQNVRMFLYDGQSARRTASGVCIGSETGPQGSFSYVLTNAHAVDTHDLSKPRFAVLIEGEGEALEYSAEPIAVGSVPEMDLALLKVEGVKLPAAELGEDVDLQLGEDVIVAAAPYGRAISISGGMVSQVERDHGTRRPVLLKTDAPIGYGASGGGIYSLSSGKLLAIVEGYRTAKIGFAVADQPYSFDVPMPGETFAAPCSKVRNFLQAKGFGRLVERLAPAVPSRAQAALR